MVNPAKAMFPQSDEMVPKSQAEDAVGHILRTLLE